MEAICFFFSSLDKQMTLPSIHCTLRCIIVLSASDREEAA
jgi:hypothetical protein